MQTLGLDERPYRSEGFFKRFLWPNIQDDVDVRDAARNAFFVYFVGGQIQLLLLVLLYVQDYAQWKLLLFPFPIYDFALAIGVRRYSLIASLSGVALHALGLLANPAPIPFLLLGLKVSALRASIVGRRISQDVVDAGESAPDSFFDHLADDMPRRLWPIAKWLVYVMPVVLVIGAGVLLVLMVIGLMLGPARSPQLG